eukprot:m.245518 g.245518  ORF g.245518 m.245518 type:complete len:761 (-) comp16108_c1_seq21:2323-4605(-)
MSKKPFIHVQVNILNILVISLEKASAGFQTLKSAFDGNVALLHEALDLPPLKPFEEEQYKLHTRINKQCSGKLHCSVGLNNPLTPDEVEKAYDEGILQAHSVFTWGQTLLMLSCWKLYSPSLRDKVLQGLKTSGQPFHDLINYADNAGETALQKAVHYGHMDCITTLLEHGADMTQPQNRGETAYTYSVLHRYHTQEKEKLAKSEEIHTYLRGRFVAWKEIENVLISLSDETVKRDIRPLRSRLSTIDTLKTKRKGLVRKLSSVFDGGIVSENNQQVDDVEDEEDDAVPSFENDPQPATYPPGRVFEKCRKLIELGFGSENANIPNKNDRLQIRNQFMGFNSIPDQDELLLSSRAPFLIEQLLLPLLSCAGEQNLVDSEDGVKYKRFCKYLLTSGICAVRDRDIDGYIWKGDVPSNEPPEYLPGIKMNGKPVKKWKPPLVSLQDRVRNHAEKMLSKLEVVMEEIYEKSVPLPLRMLTMDGGGDRLTMSSSAAAKSYMLREVTVGSVVVNFDRIVHQQAAHGEMEWLKSYDIKEAMRALLDVGVTSKDIVQKVQRLPSRLGGCDERSLHGFWANVYVWWLMGVAALCDKFLQTWLDSTFGFALRRAPLKSESRIKEKRQDYLEQCKQVFGNDEFYFDTNTVAEYSHHVLDAGGMLDLCRFSIICNSPAELVQIYESFMRRRFSNGSDFEVIRVKNWFHPSAKLGPGKYRDVKLNLVVKVPMPKGGHVLHIVEAQLILEDYAKMKKHMHLLYCVHRGDYFGR